MKSTIRFSGARELDAALAELPRAMQSRVARTAIRRGGAVVRKAVREEVPVDTGRGKKEITLTARSSRRGPIRVTVHTGRAFYLLFSEFGTSRQPARPFFAPALDRSAGDAFAAMAEGIQIGLDREVKRLSRIRKL